MSLLPPTLSAPAPAQTGTASASAAASSTASSRGGEAGQSDASSFGDVLSRSLAASGESSAKASGKPAVSVPVKRVADEKKDGAAELVNTAALLFVPLEIRIPTTTAAPSGGLPGKSATAATPAEAVSTAAAANDADFSVDAEAQAPQALIASGLAVTPAKDRALASTTAAPTSAGDGLATALPASKVAVTPGGGQSEQFSGRESRPSGETQEILGTDTRAEQKPGSAKTSFAATNDASDKAADKAAPQAAVDGSPATAGQRSGGDHAAASPSFSISSATAPVHTNAAATSPAAPVASSQAALTPEVGSGEWGKALGQHMVHMGKAGEHVAELQLNPPGLGPLKVTLSMNDNQVQALFVSAHSSVRAAVEAALPQLRSTLADSGISLGDTSVNSGSQQQPAFAQSQNGQSGQSGARGQPGYPSPGASPLAAPSAEPPARRGNSLGVDTYA